MSIQPKLKELIFASYDTKEYDPIYTKVLILNAFFFITLLTTVILLFVNILLGADIKFVIIDISLFFPTLYMFVTLRKQYNYRQVANFGNGLFFIVFLAINFFAHGQDLSLIWSYFFIPFSLITLGARRGLYLSIVFILLNLIITYQGINTWLDTSWNIPSYIRYAISQFIMLYAIYTIAHNNEKTYEKIEELRKKEKLKLQYFEELSLIDPLTKLYNRRSLRESFCGELHKIYHTNEYFAYFVLDIDYYKDYNDTYGHQKGDEILTKTAALIKKNSKYAFRLGGDEFSGIIIDKEREAIENKLKKLQESIYNMHIENRNSPVSQYLTCSVGAYILQKAEHNFNAIYESADKALYKAKARGRNQIVIYNAN